MRDVEQAAVQSVARGVGFGALAIGLVVVGLAGYPLLALRSGAALTLLMWAILRLKALRAPRRPYKRTEVWLLLEPRPDWPAEIAQRLIGGTLQRTLERFARPVLAVALASWCASLALPTSGPALTANEKGRGPQAAPPLRKPCEASLTGGGSRRGGSAARARSAGVGTASWV